MELVLGLDPGGGEGGGRFGWAVAEKGEAAPVRIRATGTQSHAVAAISAAFEHVAPGDHVEAAGIDSPMYWTATGERKADLRLRKILRQRGAGSSAGGTVQHPNSLQGACVIQGPIAALLLRRRLPNIPLTESHPKALLWALQIASNDLKPSGVAAGHLGKFVCGHIGASEDERDATLGAFAAWAMVTQAPGWSDLVALEEDPLFFVSEDQLLVPE